MKYLNKFKKVIKNLKSSGKYRIFNSILRKRGNFQMQSGILNMA